MHTWIMDHYIVLAATLNLDDLREAMTKGPTGYNCLNKLVLFLLLGSKHQPPNYVARLKRI